jgi:RNA polymerase sigma-70 factor, ECF subfamily
MSEDVEGRSDAVLVLGVARGDQQALGELYRRYASAVWGLARRVTNDAHEAEEVCQTVFVNLWTAPERFDPTRGSLRSWLLAQAHRRAVDLVRSEVSRRQRQAREAQLSMASPRIDEVDTTVHAAALADEVRQAVEELPPAERDAIMLAYFGGRTYRETASLLGQPEGTVKSRIRSGLQNLRRALRAKGVTA